MEKESKETENICDPLLNKGNSKEEDKSANKKRQIFQVIKVTDHSQESGPRKAKRSCPGSKITQCSICYQPIEVQGIIETCKHEFCSDCIYRWSKVGWMFILDKKCLSNLQKKIPHNQKTICIL